MGPLIARGHGGDEVTRKSDFSLFTLALVELSFICTIFFFDYFCVCVLCAWCVRERVAGKGVCLCFYLKAASYLFFWGARNAFEVIY